jgi:hypothetical protein
VLLPRNTEWIQYPPEAEARLEAVLDRIHEQTGVTIRNYQDAGFGPEHFSDTTHLPRHGGDVPFTEFLAEEYRCCSGQNFDSFSSRKASVESIASCSHTG